MFYHLDFTFHLLYVLGTMADIEYENVRPEERLAI